MHIFVSLKGIGIFRPTTLYKGLQGGGGVQLVLRPFLLTFLKKQS